MTFKSRFKKTFAYTWYLYLIAIVIPSVAFPISYSFMHRPQEYEKLNLFLSNPVNDVDKLKNTLSKKFQDKGVKNIEIIISDASDSEYAYYQKLTVVGLNRCDVLLIPESKVSKLNIPGSFLEINDEVERLCDSKDETYYVYENKNYGIKISEESPLNEYIAFPKGENYYTFLGANSWNIGDYSTKATNTKNAFDLTKYLIGK